MAVIINSFDPTIALIPAPLGIVKANILNGKIMYTTEPPHKMKWATIDLPAGPWKLLFKWSDTKSNEKLLEAIMPVDENGYYPDYSSGIVVPGAFSKIRLAFLSIIDYYCDHVGAPINLEKQDILICKYDDLRK